MSRYIYFLLLIYGCVFSQSECKCEPLNTWYKISNNPIDSGRLLELDLSHGFAYADPYTIYLILIDKGTGEEMVIQFTNNSHFKVEDSTPSKPENSKMSLEEYLKHYKKFNTKIEK